MKQITRTPALTGDCFTASSNVIVFETEVNLKQLVDFHRKFLTNSLRKMKCVIIQANT